MQGNIHLHIEPVLRSSGQSLIMRVAYQTAGAMRNPRTGQWHNFRYKSSEIGGTLLITPHAETSNREAITAFWGQVEQHHKRKDAVPGRTASVALPCELSREENLRLMYGYGRWLSKTYGIGVQVTAHQLDGGNPHFHLTITSCAVLPDGSFGKKVMRLDPIAMQRNKEESPAETLRATWADMVNKAYAEAGIAEHVDHRSYERRGINKIPTEHEGVRRYAPCPVDSPAELNAGIRLCNLARREEEKQARMQETIRKELQQARHAKNAAKQAADRQQSPGQPIRPQKADDAKGGPATPVSAPPHSKLQDAPAGAGTQQSWDVRAWEIIKSFARAMPKTTRETMLLAACLRFCEKNPRVTAGHIKNILALHSKSTAAEQQRVIARVTEFIAGRQVQKVEGKEKGGEESKTAASKAAPLPQEPAAPEPVNADSVPEGRALPQAEQPVPQPVAAAAAGKPSQTASSEETRRASPPAQPTPGADAEGGPAVPQTGPPASKPQDAPAVQASQQTGYARAWEIIKSFARAMPKTTRETMLLAACLQFCEKYPRVTAGHIKNILALHSKSTAAEQQRVIERVTEFIAGRQVQKAEGKEKGWEERNTEASKATALLPQEPAAPEPVNADSVPEGRALPQAEEPVPQPVAVAAMPVPPAAGPANSTGTAINVTPPPDAASAVPAPSQDGILPEDPAGPSFRSALQAYCEQHAEQARKAGERGEAGRRGAIMAGLRSPAGDQLAGLRRWLFRHYPAVAQETAKRLSLARRTPDSEGRLHKLGDVLQYLPPVFVRYRLGIEMQEGCNDAAAGVAAAMNCSRSEAVQRLAAVMPDLMRLGQDAAGKNAAWLDRMNLYEQQKPALKQPLQEECHGISPA